LVEGWVAGTCEKMWKRLSWKKGELRRTFPHEIPWNDYDLENRVSEKKHDRKRGKI
jgi:hypothetical protein